MFEELLGVSLRSWGTLMKLHVNFTFNLNWKKQVLMLQLLALIHAQRRKYKTGLKAIYAAQTIVSELDETIERNLDYVMVVNTLTGFLLLSISKPLEAFERFEKSWSTALACVLRPVLCPVSCHVSRWLAASML